MSKGKTVNITVLVPAGILPLKIMETAHRLASQHGARVYLSNTQNLRLIDVPEEVADAVKAELKGVGADFKGPGKFPLPRVCVGKDHCNLGLIDTEVLNGKILEKFSGRPHTKGKIKIAIAACGMSCTDAKTTDIGIIATRDGFDVYAGGKGGTSPQVGRRIARSVSEQGLMAIIEELVEFHDRKTEKKKRMFKLLDDAEFPY